MHSVLVDRPLHVEALTLLSNKARVVAIYDDDREKILKALAEVDGVICSAALKMGEEEITLGKNLKVIGRPGAGYDSVDIKAATRMGIPVVYTPDGPTESVAEHVIGLMIMLAKKLPMVEKALKEEGDFRVRTRVTGMELFGKTLGIIGAGRIGRRTAEIASLGLGMKIIVFDPYMGENGQSTRQEFTRTDNMKTLLENADFVSLHVPFTEETRRLIGKDEFKLMKETAYFINTARGGIVDEPALIDALVSGSIAGAGLDVFEKEPPDPDNPLFKLDNTVVTPHISSFTSDGKRKMGVAVVQSSLDVLSGKVPEYMVNPEVWEKRRK